MSKNHENCLKTGKKKSKNISKSSKLSKNTRKNRENYGKSSKMSKNWDRTV